MRQCQLNKSEQTLTLDALATGGGSGTGCLPDHVQDTGGTHRRHTVSPTPIPPSLLFLVSPPQCSFGKTKFEATAKIAEMVNIPCSGIT